MRLNLPASLILILRRIKLALASLQRSAGRTCHDVWNQGALRVGYMHLLERVRAGDLPPVALRATARDRIATSFTEGSSVGMTDAQKDDLHTLSQAILDAIR